MNVEADGLPEQPRVRPADPRFSCGPCKKYPGWDISRLNLESLGRNHRGRYTKQRLADAITRSHRLLGLPDDWRLGIVPGSDTGAFEMAIWSMLGTRPIDVFAWEAFSGDWVTDLKQLAFDNVNLYISEYGEIPDLSRADAAHDIVTVYNGTTSGVRLPNLDWVAADREGLVLCDATSAAFAMPMDFAKLDVVTWSWQKVLGGEAAHGMLALSPRAVERLETTVPAYPLPKLFRLTKGGRLNEGIFKGSTINTPSLLAVEDLHVALDWAERIGGLDALCRRTRDNFDCVDSWVGQTAWVDWLARDPAVRSPTSLCLRIVDEAFTRQSVEAQQAAIDRMVARLESEAAGYDIANYRTAPPGFRLWGGATVERDDLQALLPWLDWAYACDGGER